MSRQPALRFSQTFFLVFMALLLPVLGAMAGGAYLYSNTWSRVGLGGLVALSALVGGGMLGFLFGIPRSLQGDQRGGRYGVNTNLEQISDWLTKILVGVGLIQLGSITNAASRLFVEVGNALGGGQPATIAAGALLSFFAVTGFLTAYVMARTVLRGLFEWFDASQVESVVDATVDERSSRDSDAIRLATQQLDEHGPEVDTRQLRRTLSEATPSVRTQAFLLAANQRSANWRDPVTKSKVSRTVPVFDVLTEIESPDHRHWGQLGFALKDQVNPDRSRAIAALDTAISRRGNATENGYELYEFARALARAAQLNATPFDDTTESAIRKDLAVAFRNESIRRRIAEALRRIADRSGHVDFADLEIERIKQFLPRG